MQEREIYLLKEWFLNNSRDLPWRNQPSPYAVWVSEVMLQQTQVAVVIPYFLKWMRRFPTIEALAQAPEEVVLKEWEGLGYYSRARNLHKGARQVVECYAGILPDRPEELQKIQGLGPYTIGAILSFAFKQKAAAVDGNVLRVLTRFYNIHDDIGKSSTQKQLRQKIEEFLPDQEPWIISEALIELGATVCKRQPLCLQCPLRNSCLARQHDTALYLPRKAERASVTVLHRLTGVVYCQGRILVRKAPKGKIMAGLHEFPFLELSQAPSQPDLFIDWLVTTFQVKIQTITAHPLVKHGFTRYHAHLYPYRINCHADQILDQDPYVWKTHDELLACAFPSGHRQLISLV